MQWTRRLLIVFLPLIVLLPLLPLAAPLSAEDFDLYRDVLVVRRSIDGSTTEAAGDLSGPILQDLTADGLAAVDVPGTSTPRPELLTHSAESGTTVITWLDLDTATGDTGEIDPAPPVAFVSLAALDATGGLARDLVGATTTALWQLDLQAGGPWQQRPPAAGAPATFVALAAADVLGTGAEQLIATDGVSLFVTEPLDDSPVWTPLAGPAGVGSIDALTSTDAGLITGEIGGPLEREVARLLTVHVAHQSWYYVPDPVTNLLEWSDARSRRLEVASAAATSLTSGPGVSPGDFILPIPLATSDIQFSGIVDPESELGAPYDPVGDGHCPGAVFADLDADGLPDLYLPRGKIQNDPMNPDHDSSNWLFRNQGDGTFASVDEAADEGNGAGALAADFDNDGRRDLFVINAGEPNVLFRQTATGFVDITAATDPTPGVDDVQVGLAFARPVDESERPPDCLGPLDECILDDSLAAAAGDFNRDGYLDLYVGNHLCCEYDDGQRDVLYLNDGDADVTLGWDGTFTDITTAAGIEADPLDVHKSTQAVLVADFDNNGWPDIYVTIKGNAGGACGKRDRLYLNDGDTDGTPGWDGTFTDWFAVQPVPSCNVPNTPGNFTGAAMGIDAADYDNDGDLDIFLTDIGQMDLYRNRLSEDGVFSLELAVESVDPPVHLLASPDWAWGASWSDFDNDGDSELHVATAGYLMNYLHENQGDDVFVDVALDAGAGQAWESRASVPGDLDADGRVDLLVTHRGARPIDLLQNETEGDNNWLQVALTGDPDLPPAPRLSTRDAVGARLVLEIQSPTGDIRRQQREVRAGGHTCASTRDYVASFGLGEVEATDAVTLTVFWPSGRVTSLPVGTLDQRLSLVEQ